MHALLLLLAIGYSTVPQPKIEPVQSVMRPTILPSSTFEKYAEQFNDDDKVAGRNQSLSIPNDKALSFLKANIPYFDCPDKKFEEIYYYRWWSFRKHLNHTPAGWVVTEFLPVVPWASIYNTISCAAGHHLYEGRWLNHAEYMSDYARFWLLPEASPRSYCFWAADSVRALTLATGDKRLAQELLPNLAANYGAWEKTNLDPNGFFRQIDDRDGMEFSLGGSGYRPTLNSYMYGDARAIAEMANEVGDHELSVKFNEKSAKIKRLVQTHLWNKNDAFFETAKPVTDLSQLHTQGIRELVGFVPWYFNLPDSGFESAWKQLTDAKGFAGPFGPTTAERRASGFMHSENHDCLWNGPSWPYATTQTLVAMANLVENYPQNIVSKQDYFDLLSRYAQSQHKDCKPWVAEDLNADTGKWIVDLPRSENYNHSGFADLVITGLVGLRPRSDEKLVVKPLVPSGTWPWFCLDAIPYHGHSITVLWDQDNTHYGRGSGLTMFVDGRKVAHRDDLGELSVDLPSKTGQKKPLLKPDQVWTKHPGGAVLGGELGTCFDIAMLRVGRKINMYFSWRPKKSVALVQSEDGIHWSAPKILIDPAPTGWEDDINRPAVIHEGGMYHMWYTGQFNGHSSIGYATSKDGLKWERRAKPVLEAERPWEKVAVMCPTVNWDATARQFRMWYSGGDQYEPDAIGYAVSSDGIHWQKHTTPVFEADPANRWEQHKVTACQVIEWQGWHYMFYIGFRDVDHAQIGIARSKDGITAWQRMKNNPIISPTVDGWDADACYKPFALYDKASDRWMLWYNGRHQGSEQIGLATKPGRGLGF